MFKLFSPRFRIYFYSLLCLCLFGCFSQVEWVQRPGGDPTTQNWIPTCPVCHQVMDFEALQCRNPECRRLLAWKDKEMQAPTAYQPTKIASTSKTNQSYNFYTPDDPTKKILDKPQATQINTIQPIKTPQNTTELPSSTISSTGEDWGDTDTQPQTIPTKTSSQTVPNTNIKQNTDIIPSPISQPIIPSQPEPIISQPIIPSQPEPIISQPIIPPQPEPIISQPIIPPQPIELQQPTPITPQPNKPSQPPENTPNPPESIDTPPENTPNDDSWEIKDEQWD